MEEPKETEIKVPEKCLICSADYAGGHELPGNRMKTGCRVFYQCGASMSVKILDSIAYQILYKNCGG